jgi:phenylacetate-CoA ligase/benzoylacetate-CoA ligase
MWAECEEESGMHFTAQKYVMVELVDPATGNHLPWEPGVCGETVYTTIRREATPVLRYRSADLIRVEGVTCSCGRTSPKIRCIGRVDDMLVFKAMNVFPSAIRDVVLKHFDPFLTGYVQIVKDNAQQFRFDTPIPVDIEVKSIEDNLPELKRKIEQKVKGLLSVRIEANLVAPDTIPRTEYKTPLVRVRNQ